RPVVNVSYAIDRAIWGVAPFGFHLTNVALHALVVVLFYAFCRRAIRDERPADGQRARWPAFAAASHYGVHPMMTEAAGYVSGRSEVLCAAGFLAALLAARRAIVSGRRAPAIAAILAAIALAAAIVVAVRARARLPLAAVGAVWFIAAIAPSSSIVPLREGMAEHRVYLASGGLFLAMAAALRAVPATYARFARVA